jgi:hypothetical protein
MAPVGAKAAGDMAAAAIPSCRSITYKGYVAWGVSPKDAKKGKIFHTV